MGLMYINDMSNNNGVNMNFQDLIAAAAKRVTAESLMSSRFDGLSREEVDAARNPLRGLVA